MARSMTLPSRSARWKLAALVVLAAASAGTAAPIPGATIAGPDPAEERATAAGGERPHLVVLISIDQFRGDYLTRFTDLFLPPESGAKVGGFRWLMERGAYFADAHHDHFPLYTAPGHSVLLTGAPPYESGIVGNAWYDRALGRRRYCVEDPASPLVGTLAPPPNSPAAPGTTASPTAATPASAARPGISPATLRVDTVGDELKMATGGRAKVWGLAFKDRAAVLMAGHLADGVLWFDDETGAWITSRYYRPDGTLPDWVARYNDGHHAAAWFGKEWGLSVPASALARLWTPTGRYAGPLASLGAAFPHSVTGGASQPGKSYYAAFTSTPFGNDFTLATARELIEHEHLGRHDTPDLLAINLTSNDYVGHAFGPDSPEVLDVTVRTDRQLADFFNFLGQTLPGGLRHVTVAVTADHGVAPLPGAARDAHLPAGIFDDADLAAAAERGLDAAYGPGPWVKALVEAYLYLDLAALDAHKIPRAAAEETAAAALAAQPGIYAAYPRSRVLEGRLPHTEIAARIERSFHPGNAGEVVLVPDPFWMSAGKLLGTTHGSPYTYDTYVPLLLGGAGIRPGRFTGRVSTLDLAPTLANLLGILAPAGSEGHILPALEPAAPAHPPHRAAPAPSR
jgi:predicted AlkP superfamily pyrophosphatase or phosphodiesterase